MKTWSTILFAGALLTSFSGVALADDPPPDTTAGAGATVTVVTPATPAAPARPASVMVVHENEGDTDHERVVGHFAVGYFGVSQLPIGGVGGAGGGVAAASVNAPVIGVRYWLQRRLGLDLGLGFGMTSGSVTTTVNGVSQSVDKQSSLGFAVHGGVPLAMAQGKHFTFEVIPEALVGFTTSTIKSAMPGVADTSLTGFRLDLGARIGGEIQFGFIGIPELALQGSVGLYFRHDNIGGSVGNNSTSDSTNTLATSVQADPWAIFTNNISALYYF